MTEAAAPTGLPARPLAGITVVEVGVWHAGPGAGAILGDLGAEVIKVESLEGDPERGEGGTLTLKSQAIDTPGWSLMFELSNRNKRGIALDLTSDRGRQVLHRLVERADVFLTNLRPGAKRKLGIDYESLATVNPGLVHVNVSGFGSEGPLAQEGAFDTLGQALAGMFYVTGHEVPQPLPVVVVDQLTAQTAAQAAITALLARERSGGEGQDVHVSLYGSGALLWSAQLLWQAALDTTPIVTYDRIQKTPLLSVYRCKDDHWVVGTNPGRALWPTFAEAIGAPALGETPWDVDDRASQEALYAAIDPLMLERTAAEWVAYLRSKGLLFAPVQDFEQVLADEQARANGYVVEVDHPRLGTIPLPGSPFAFGKQLTSQWTPAPEHGGHTDEILRTLGYDGDDIAALREHRVVV
ncbi:CaiB/BaiF CoA transferase family protein [Agromyces aerolatus]|uniref:CaiB/BaiF CoA transferase family protein n=1 Tax=Agromyces sp. LY-1074 TaxID=3074080 RepID=UPI002861A488|nr:MULTISPECIES: CoA transferase [unclassified Agromyces]MDR5699118.1 CoA transferase [Agromyces sp. LY-1074]MDR5705103.1 CoA transferase [Agromyces sp. LY-1358]